jgi:NAD-dependent DNA ligase
MNKFLQKLEDEVMIHRYLYYIEYTPILQDYEFDMLERKARKELSAFPESPVHGNGSELSDSYSPKVKELALEWMY